MAMSMENCICSRLLVGPVGVILVLGMTFGFQSVQSQDLQVVALQSAAAGGSTSAGQYQVFSSIGAAPASGTSENGLYSVTSSMPYLRDVRPVSETSFVHEPVAAAHQGEDLTVSGTLESDDRIDRATLFYRRGGSPGYSTVELAESGSGVLQAQIPGEDVTSEGLAYYFEFEDRARRVSRSPVGSEYGVAVRIEEPGLSLPEALPGGSDLGAYRIVSVPLDLDDGSPQAVYGDDLGPYDSDVWRFFELRFDQRTREHPNTNPIEAGKGYWLITSERQSAVDTGPGLSIPPSQSYSIPVHPTWNLIGSPFNYLISTSNLSLRSGERVELRAFDGGWNDPIGEPVAALEPFSGYALYSPSSAVDTLDVHPRPQTTAGKHEELVVDVLDWWIRIAARSGRSQDRDNVAGMSQEASSGLDRMDYREPPAVESSVSVYFSRPDWDEQTSAFSTDIRPLSPDGDRWEFEVRSETGKAVGLAFEGLETVPPEFDVLLHDQMAGVLTDLRESPSYMLSGGGSTARRLTLIVGSGELLDDADDRLALTPESVELDPVFPNPVRSSMTVRYGLPESAHVSLRLFDATGRLLQEIDGGARAAGRHVFVWDRGGFASPVASGVYLLELQADGVRRARPITIVR